MPQHPSVISEEPGNSEIEPGLRGLGRACPGGRPGRPGLGRAWAEQGWVGGFEDSRPSFLQGHCLLHAWESTVLLAYPASRSLCPRWLCREPGLTSPPPVCSLFLSWGVPLVITVAAVTLKKIGYDASDVSVGWCWIDLEAEDCVLWMLLTGKAWEMLAYVTLPVLYLLIRKHINRAVGAPRGPGPELCVATVSRHRGWLP